MLFLFINRLGEIMKNNSVFFIVIALSLVLISNKTDAIEPLSTKELALHCSSYASEPKGVDAAFCVRYIQGFIDGAVATDDKVLENALDNLNSRETFSERAIRLRKARRISNSPTYYADFCLGSREPLKVIVEKIISRFSQRKFNSKNVPAREAVYQILRNEYPCSIN